MKPLLIVIDQNETHVLQAEKMTTQGGKWWLELIEKSTGLAQIVVCNNKKCALTCFDGMTLDEVQKWLDKAKFEKLKTYKKNYKPSQAGGN